MLDQDSQEPANGKALHEHGEAVKEAQKNRLGDIDRETLVNIYQQMVLCRRFEERPLRPTVRERSAALPSLHRPGSSLPSAPSPRFAKTTT